MKKGLIFSFLIFYVLMCCYTQSTEEDFLSSAWEAFGREDYDQAIAYFTQAIRLNPNVDHYYMYRAIVYQQKGDYDREIADITEALRLASTNRMRAYYYGNRGNAYRQKGDLNLAISDLTEAIRLEPSVYFWTYYYRGLIYEQQNNLTLALADFVMAIHLDKEGDGTRINSVDIQRILNIIPNLGSFWTVNNTASWIETVNGIRNGGNNKVHIITLEGNISVPPGTSFVVNDTLIILQGNGTLSLSSNGSLLSINNKQTVIIKDITLQGRESNNSTLVSIGSEGAFRMEGSASIIGNKCNSNSGGGGVSVYGTFIMQDDAMLSDNRITSNYNWYANGGGVFVGNSGIFSMNGNASVSNNTSSGVYVIDEGRFFMYGSSSVTNNSGTNGGGIYIGRTSTGERYGRLYMYGNASVSGNTASQSGGGIYGGSIYMYGNSIITGNSSGHNGGGVCFDAWRENFFMYENASVSGNTAGYSGGGVYIQDGTFTMQSGNISGNRANRLGGGGVSVGRGSFIMQGGIISGNITSGDGGGVYNIYGGGNNIPTKTDGVIYGSDEQDTNLRNIANRGHALYDGQNRCWRNSTSGQTTNTGAYGFWLND